MEEQGRSLCIVPMQPQHIDQLERLEKECFSAPWSYDALVSELSNPLAVFRVAQQPDGSVAGYVGMHTSSTRALSATWRLFRSTAGREWQRR